MAVIYTHFYQLPEGEKQYFYEHRLGRELLARGLKELYQISLTPEELDAEINVEEGHKPVLTHYPEIHYNISHCDDLVVCGFSDQEIGVDVEKFNRYLEAIYRKLFTPEEKEFFARVADTEELKKVWMFRFWTLKESFLKMNGIGLARELNSFSFTFDTECTPMTISCSEDVSMYQEIQRENYVFAVCTPQPETVTFINIK